LAGHPSGWLATFVLAITLAGCGSRDSIPAASLEPSVDPARQERAKTIAADFVKAVQSEDRSLDRYLDPTSSLKASAFKKGGGPYASFFGASALQVDSVGSSGHGKKVVLRTHFLGADGKTYRTNFTLLGKGEDLRINMVLPPTYATKPVVSGASMGKM